MISTIEIGYCNFRIMLIKVALIFFLALRGKKSDKHTLDIALFVPANMVSYSYLHIQQTLPTSERNVGFLAANIFSFLQSAV